MRAAARRFPIKVLRSRQYLSFPMHYVTLFCRHPHLCLKNVDLGMVPDELVMVSGFAMGPRP